MNENIAKWALGVSAPLSVAAVLGMIAAWSQLSGKVDEINITLREMQAERPARDDFRNYQNDQLRLAIQLNAQELDIQSMMLDDIRDRVLTLEAQR